MITLNIQFKFLECSDRDNTDGSARLLKEKILPRKCRIGKTRLFNIIISIIVMGLIITGCAEKSKQLRVMAGQEVSLSIGQEVLIEGEDLKIEFTDVIEDSRCPKNVTCVWQGQATCALRITSGEISNNLVN